MPIMWHGELPSPEGVMNMQWSGIEAAGITNTAMTDSTAVTNSMVRVNFHSTMLQI